MASNAAKPSLMSRQGRPRQRCDLQLLRRVPCPAGHTCTGSRVWLHGLYSQGVVSAGRVCQDADRRIILHNRRCRREKLLSRRRCDTALEHAERLAAENPGCYADALEQIMPWLIAMRGERIGH